MPNDYSAAMAYLLELKASGVSLGLERMQRFIAAAGNPHREVPCIHLAGTNGKGSVAAMVDAILRAAGWRTGLYTSPHLVRLGERVQVDRCALTEQEIVGGVRALQPIAEQGGAGERPSYFEFMTGLAFRHFAHANCDVACIEVGMGGRLDATNVITPEVSVITSIALDHTQFLGTTISEIAREKAGIIKPGRPVVLGWMPLEAERAIRKVAAERGATVFSVEESFGDDVVRYPRTNLEGEHQRINAATATLAVRALAAKWKMSDALIERALQQIAWPARWQRFVAGARQIILDASHNGEGAVALDRSLQHLSAGCSEAPIIVVGVLGSERARALLEVACRHARELRLVVPAQGRACSHEQLKALIPASYNRPVMRDSVDSLFPAPRSCSAGESGSTIVVTGSLSLAGEVLSRLEPERGPYEGQWQDF